MKLYFYLLLIIILIISSISKIRSDSIGICAVVRREGSILIEWIEYHALIGVNNFYIYLAPADTISQEEYLLTRALLQPYTSPNNRSFHMELLAYPHNLPNTCPQALAYESCMSRFSRFNTWLLFIDVDEFVVFPSGFHLAPVLSQHIPKNAPKFGGLCLTWVNLAPSPPYDRPDAVRPADSLLMEIPNFHAEWSPVKRGKLAIYTHESTELTQYCRFAFTTHYVHQCFQRAKDVEVFSTEGKRLPASTTCDTPEWPTTLGLYHYFFRTCHEWVNELVPKRTEYNRQLNYQNRRDDIRYSPKSCSQADTYSLENPLIPIHRFLPFLRERVSKHPLWGTHISFDFQIKPKRRF